MLYYLIFKRAIQKATDCGILWKKYCQHNTALKDNVAKSGLARRRCSARRAEPGWLNASYAQRFASARSNVRPENKRNRQYGSHNAHRAQ